MKQCIICNKELTGQQQKFCSPSCKNKYHQPYKKQKAKGVQRKKELITLLGGCCSICGYNKNLAALCFHHLDPSLKEYRIDLRALSNRSIESVMDEVKKCILVCTNCHMELHYPDLDISG